MVNPHTDSVWNVVSVQVVLTKAALQLIELNSENKVSMHVILKPNIAKMLTRFVTCLHLHSYHYRYLHSLINVQFTS